MLGARIFIFNFAISFSARRAAAELIGKPKIDSRAGDSRPAFELSGQSLAQSIAGHRFSRATVDDAVAWSRSADRKCSLLIS